MKVLAGIIVGFVILMASPGAIIAQDVYISLPASNIFSRSEYNTIENVLNTNGYDRWRKLLGLLGIALLAESPNFSSTQSSFRIDTEKTLPTNVLQWQLSTIGGSTNIQGGSIPGYNTFGSGEQTWFNLSLLSIGIGSDYSPGNVAFKFRIAASNFINYAFHAGNYTLPVVQNYGTPSSILESNIIFSPASFNMILSIPASIAWLSGEASIFFEITSLNQYRSASEHILGDIGGAELGHTVDFDLRARAASPNIQFTSSKNVQGTRNISLIRLGSTNSHLTTSALSANWQDFTISPFEVQVGNRTNFTQELSISANDFKNHFFEAGTYTFQLIRDARSLDNSASNMQTTDVSIVVPALSEISIGSSGQTVSFSFNSPAHYTQGQSKVIPGHLRLSNNEDFELYVKSSTSYFAKSGIQSDVASSTLHVGLGQNPDNLPLSTIPQKIISNGNPVLDQEIDIRYTIPPQKAQSLLDKEKTGYTIDVIYSFTAL